MSELGLHCCADLSPAVARGGYALITVLGLLIMVASLVAGAQALGGAGFSSCGSWALEYKLNSCGTQAELFRVM